MKKLFSYVLKQSSRTGIKGSDIFAVISVGFILSSIVFVLSGDVTSLSYTEQYPLFLSIAICLISSLALFFAAIGLCKKRIIALFLVLSAVVLGVLIVLSLPKDIFLNIGIGAILILVAKYACDTNVKTLEIKLSRKSSLIALWVMIAVFTAVVFFFTALRYKSFYHSTFDFGIFAQMFENMCETGLPTTTVERTGELSHFAVHFSPFFYLLLPGYFVFRSPLYLLFVQALFVALGALAVRRICKGLYFSEKSSLAICAVYLLFPTLANGCFYDFHENKFLTVLILWAVAFALEKKPLQFCAFSFLILTVKEDAFIYVLAICLWMIISDRMRPLAIGVGAFSLIWFLFACSIMVWLGGEIMESRFSNFSHAGDAGLLSCLRNCFVNIGYLIREVFSGADTETFREMTYSGQKLELVLWTCFPLCFAPFLRKRPSELVLLLPMLVINLMPDWMYQYNVDFQYTYGTAALLIVLFVLFLRETGERTRRLVLLASLMMCIVFTSSLVVPKAKTYSQRYFENMEAYEKTEDALAIIEPDASVTAYGYIMPHLSHIKDLRTCPKHDRNTPYEKTDYFVIDTRYENDAHSMELWETMGDEYEQISHEGFVKIFRHKDS